MLHICFIYFLHAFLSNIQIVFKNFNCIFHVFHFNIFVKYFSVKYTTLVQHFPSPQFLYLLHAFQIPFSIISFCHLINIQSIYFKYSIPNFSFFYIFCHQIFIHYSKVKFFTLHIFYISSRYFSFIDTSDIQDGCKENVANMQYLLYF